MLWSEKKQETKNVTKGEQGNLRIRFFSKYDTAVFKFISTSLCLQDDKVLWPAKECYPNNMTDVAILLPHLVAWAMPRDVIVSKSVCERTYFSNLPGQRLFKKSFKS